jgi:hypothetical protein
MSRHAKGDTMNIEELLQSLPSREEIANAVGFYSQNKSVSPATDVLPALAIFGTGMMIGAGLALLFAPKPGSELRRELAHSAENLGDQAREIVSAATGHEHQPAADAPITAGA